jgi:peptide/nickel transport system substrate-binding protein
MRDLQLTTRMGYETLLRWDRDGNTVVPGIAERVESRDGAKTFVAHLRRGMRWSDGHPFTSDDFVFMHRHVQGHPALMPAVPSRWKVGGVKYVLEAPDPHTVIFRFAEPYGMFVDMLAFMGRQNELFTPAHYSKRYHRDFRAPAELDAEARSAGYADWSAYYIRQHDLDLAPACPVLGPFVLRVPFPAQRCVAVRNPYYWKVDPHGNQLPYIDEVTYDRVLDQTMLNLRALDGKVDFQNRGIDAANFTLFSEAGKSKGYRVQADYATSATGVYINQHSRDATHRPILQDRRFRIALSLAINRPEAVELIYNGLGIIDNGVTQPEDRYYLPGLDQTYVQYDPREAGRLLDEVGLKQGAGGTRRWPDGSGFHEILHVFPSEGGTSADLWQLLADYWREVGLRFSIVVEDPTLSRLHATTGHSDFLAYREVSQHWQLDGTFKVPITSYCYQAPLFGHYVMTEGRQGVQPNAEQQRLINWYHEMVTTPHKPRQLELGHLILKQWAQQLYFIGVCRPIELTVISHRFRNVPQRMQHNYRLMSPGYIGIEQFYIDDEASTPAVSPAASPRGPYAPVPYYVSETQER